ncbi:hypothetical protein KOR42_45350 [Thalassoglobus neptunius]|uniref:Glycosyl transferase family 2 n=1 Tax=Thalassoglobus neptunius TaxID=1938619 RepID=A0A5C5VYG6_9PLAN|nr:hypothetical protein [Thalassoglobus neptunius]TWT43075.1 hypothetical protein KOR42_45350 [Thalassoglobus neptunius]
MNLHVVSCLFNPSKSKRIIDNYRRFRRALGVDVPVKVVELIFDDDLPIDPNAIHVRGRRGVHTLWQKERLLNIAMNSLSTDVDAVAWLDSDVVLQDGWYDRTCRLLKSHPIVQPFSKAHWLGPEWEVKKTFVSYCSDRFDQSNKTEFRHPGFAWAARREVLPDGLFDLNIVGEADSWMAHTFSGKLHIVRKQRSPQFILDAWEEWAALVTQRVQGSIGACKDELLHLYHGEYADRQYNNRGVWMVQANLQADQVVLDNSGLYTIVGNETLRRAMIDYFPARRDG